MTNKCILITAIAIVAASCQKVINLNLRTAPPKYIIEGNVTNLPGPYQVTISQTEAVNSTVPFNGVSQAKVTINDDADNTETLQETQPGIYQTTTLQGV